MISQGKSKAEMFASRWFIIDGKIRQPWIR
jgi:hypothetical protein